MRQKKNKIIVIMVMLALVLTSVPTKTSVSAASKVKLNKKKLVLYVKQSAKLKLKGTKKKVKWSSSNKKIATVSKTGKVKAKKKGNCKITAKVGKKKYVCRVTVKNRSKKATSVPKKTVTTKVPATTKKPDVTKTPGGSDTQNSAVYLKSISLQDDSIHVTFTGSITLSADNFVVESLSLTDAENATPKVLSVQKVSRDADKKVYQLTMENELPDLSKIRVTVNSSLLSGEKYIISDPHYKKFSVRKWDYIGDVLYLPIGKEMEERLAEVENTHITEKNVDKCVTAEGLPAGIGLRYDYDEAGQLQAIHVVGTCQASEKSEGTFVVRVQDELTGQSGEVEMDYCIVDAGKILVTGPTEPLVAVSGKYSAYCAMVIWDSSGVGYQFQTLSVTKDGAEMQGSSAIDQITYNYYSEERSNWFFLEGIQGLEAGKYHFTISCSSYDTDIEAATIELDLLVQEVVTVELTAKAADGVALDQVQMQGLRFYTEDTEESYEVNCIIDGEDDYRYQVKVPVGTYGLKLIPDITRGTVEVDLGKQVNIAQDTDSLELDLTTLHKVKLSDLLDITVPEQVEEDLRLKLDSGSEDDAWFSICEGSVDTISAMEMYLPEGDYKFTGYTDQWQEIFLSKAAVGSAGRVMTKMPGVAANGLKYYVTADNKAEVVGCDSNVTNLSIMATVDGYPISGFLYNPLFWCSKLEELTIGDHVDFQGLGLESCTALKKIILPEELSEDMENDLGWELSGIPNLESVTFQGDNMNFVSYDGVVYRRGAKSMVLCPAGKTTINYMEGLQYIESAALEGSRLKEIKLPATVKEISSSAFANSHAERIVIPDSVEEIESFAFSGSEVQEVILPNNAAFTVIEAMLFYECGNLKRVTVPNSVKEIEWGAFQFCSGMEEIILPAGLEIIGDFAFEGVVGTYFDWEAGGDVLGTGKITYLGTINQWKTISISEDYVALAGCTIYCSDGEYIVPEQE